MQQGQEQIVMAILSKVATTVHQLLPVALCGEISGSLQNGRECLGKAGKVQMFVARERDLSCNNRLSVTAGAEL